MSLNAALRPPRPKSVSTAVRDRAVTGLLIVALAAAAVAIGMPRSEASAVAAPATSSAPAETASPAPPQPVTYREGVVGRPESITPVTERDRADRLLVGLVFSGLVKPGPNNTLVPDLAASWTVDRSGQTWTVAIRPGAVWHDGQPVTAQDVVFTVAALKNPSVAGGVAATWADVTVEAVDAKTVRFTLGAPVGGFLAALTQPLLPSHLLASSPMADLATGAFASSPVGSGPYQLTQIDASHAVLVPFVPPAAGGSPGPGGASASLAAPPASSSAAGSSAAGSLAAAASSSPAAASSQPASSSASASPSAASAPGSGAVADPNARPLERIEVTFFDNEDALASAFQAGQIDGAAGLTPATTKDLAGTPGATVLDYPTTTLSAVLLNLRPSHPELQDPRVRKALLGAIDRSALVSATLSGQARLAATLVPPESWTYDPAQVAAVPHQPGASASLLKSAGWTKKSGKWTAPRGKAPYAITLLTVSADVNPRLAAIADVVRSSWTALGMTVSVTTLPGTDLAARLKSGDFTAAVLDIASGLEPDLYPLLDSTQVRANGSNRAGYQDPALDRLLEAARRPGTAAQRKAAWSSLLAGLSAKMPVLPLVWADEQVVVRGLSGATPQLIVHTGDRFWDVLAWRLAASR